MPILTRTFRVFVSSTFEDLKEERNALQRKAEPGAPHHEVFPSLRKLCEEHGARFQAIDLRWGVRDEAALDQKTMEICLREIERCQRTGIKPNFIVLLGQRYGWRPLPARIEASEFEDVRDHIADPEDHGLVESWYRRDDNAVPPEYLLKSRTGEWVDRTRWEEIEARLHRILLDAARAAGLSDQALVKYWASATNQEILKGLSATPEDRRHVFAFCRDVPGNECDPALVRLKEFLRAQLPAGNLRFYAPDDLEGLCQDVERTLRVVIEGEAAGFESRPAQALEIKAHDDFARERALVFGREEVLKEITEYVCAGGDRPLVLYGVSGSGKSAVMAQASERAGATLPSAVVIRRFIGASPESSSGLTLLRSLSEQIGGAYGAVGELPVDFNGVVRVFRERLAQSTSEHPLVVFVDALDQLGKDDPARSLTWLGGALPPHCRVVVSTTDVVPALNECKRLELEVLPQADASTALNHWLDVVRRQLQPAQQERLLAAFSSCGLPLYLKLAFEAARDWASYLPPEECILGDGVEGVIDTLLNRLSLEANHGPLLVRRGLGYLAAARYGLTEDEILDVLSADQEIWQDFEHRAHHTPPEHRLPVIVWSRLFLDLEPYLAERSAPGGTVASFYHRQLAEQTAARFLRGDERLRRHASLSEYFAPQPCWLDAGQTRPNARKAAELVHHQRGAEQLEESTATLADIQFVAAKCSAGLVFDLQADYPATIAFLPEAQPELREEGRQKAELARWARSLTQCAEQQRLPTPEEIIRSAGPWSKERINAECERLTENPTPLDRLRLFAGFVESECYSLLEFGPKPGFVIQHAFNHAPSGPVHQAAERVLPGLGAPLLLRRWRPDDHFQPKPAVLKTLEGHSSFVNSVSMTPDGRRAVSASQDHTLRVWDLETGECLRVLEGHDWYVRSVDVTPDGRRAVSASQDCTVRLWDLETGACLHVLEGRTGHVQSVSVTPDGRRAISRDESTLRVWDLETGACLRVMGEPAATVVCVSVTPDGRRVISANTDKTVRLWNLESWACLRVLEGHTAQVWHVSVTADGRRAVSGSQDRTVRVWDLETGACLRVLEGHAGLVRHVSVTPDGRHAVSTSDDATLRVWDLEEGTCLRVFARSSFGVLSVCVAPDGRRAVSGGLEGTVRVWDLETGTCQPVLEVHSSSVTSVSVAPDGRRAISADFEGTVRVWDLETRAHLRVLKGHSRSVSGVTVTPDSWRAVSASDDGTLRVWDLETGACLRVLEGHTDGVCSVSVAPDSRRAVSAGADLTLRVWDLETGACLRVLEGHKRFQEQNILWDGSILPAIDGAVNTVSLTPDGSRAVSGSDDETLRVWDLETGTCLLVLEGHTGRVLSVSVTPDSRYAVSASDDKTLRVWDLETGTCLLVLEGHTGRVSSVSVTPDSRYAVSASDDKTLRVWDLETGACEVVVRLPAACEAVAVSPTFGRVMAGCQVGDVYFFDCIGLTFGGVLPATIDSDSGTGP